MKKCCSNCFTSNYLENIIASFNESGTCDFCGSKNTFVVLPELLFDKFHALFDCFEAGNVYTSSLVQSIRNNFSYNLFSDKLDDGVQTELLKAIATASGSDYADLFIKNVRFKIESLNGIHVSWTNFKDEIKNENRFHISNGLDLDTLAKHFESEDLQRIISAGHILFRGRICDKNGFKRTQMANPPQKLARPGRANPFGISYLYVSDKAETTIYETRASLLDYISIGKFRVLEDLKIMNLRSKESLDFVKWIEAEEIEMFLFINQLQDELAKPYKNSDQELDYIPTQYICEFIKSLGYDGVEYRSALYSEGYNIAVFHPEKLKCISKSVHEITSINYKSNKINKRAVILHDKSSLMR